MALAFTDNFSLPMDWQLGKTLPESTGCLMRSEKYADVWFRCKDHDQSVKTDRVAAHKLILASRSPVFEAMFYGELADTSDEIFLPEIEKIPFLLFLRYLYTDETDLSEEHGIEVMHIAHKYQVTTYLGYCSKFLQGLLRIDNVSVILETARLLDDKALERSAINFMDDHADDVLRSDGFSLHVGADTLKYILTGDTLFAKEISIIEAVDKWATKYVEGQGKEVNATNKRNTIGDAFQYLRFPTMSLDEFVTVQLKYNYLTTEEERDIFNYMTNQCKSPIGIFTVSEARVPREHTYFIPPEECRTLREDDLSGMFGNSDEVSLTCSRNIELKAILISLQVGDFTTSQAKYTIENEDVVKTEEKILYHFYGSHPRVLSMSQPISLRASKNPYTLKVSVTRMSEVEPTPVKAGRKKTTTNTTNMFAFAMPIQQRQCKSTQTDPDERCSLAVKLGGINKIRGCFIHGIRYMNMSKRDQQKHQSIHS